MRLKQLFIFYSDIYYYVIIAVNNELLTTILILITGVPFALKRTIGIIVKLPKANEQA